MRLLRETQTFAKGDGKRSTKYNFYNIYKFNNGTYK